MTTITLGFKAFDPHELLCHFIAVTAGLYKKHKLQVELVDITFIPEAELPGHWFQASCGAALASAVKGIPQRVVFVATDKPMFWVYASPGIKSVAELRNKQVATFTAMAPPCHMANMIMTKAGLDVSTELTLRTARDDTARLGLLKSGNVDAAVISSAIAPARITGLGFNMLCFFGDELRIPTTGLAIDQAYLEKEPELTRILVDTHKETLSLMHNDPALSARVLQAYFDVDPLHADATARLYQSYFTKDGKTTAEIAQAAVNSLANSLNISTPVPWRHIYKF